MGSTVCRVGWTVPTQFSFMGLQVLSETSSCLQISGTNHPSTNNMKIYKDVFSGDELFSDTYPMKLVDDCLYEVYGKHVQRKIGEDFDIGANASAEEAGEGTEEAMESGVDLVLNHRLVETGFGKKADYMNYLKEYMKSLLGKFSDLQFFTGENMDPKGMIILVDYKEYNGEERPCVMFFKHGLEEEKC